ncbi:MAG: GAF domain-containing protein [Deltaproteobacteria bacterium]|nr:MAG: GAF domain-containing protein [Deltaproteobacteria bacterium]
MLQVSGYRDLDLIHLSAKSSVYRAIREEDNAPVILKAPSAELLPLSVVARYRYSFNITRALEDEGLCKTYDLLQENKRPVLVMEDIHGVGLHEWKEQENPDFEQLLSISIKVVEALANLHHQNIVHKDIKPANIVLNSESQKVQLIDFMLATQILREAKDWSPPQHLEGTLYYIAPEQTGRIHRHIDHRTDLYSLGVTLYELFVGELPFQHEDPMSLLHAHMALAPVPPHRVNSEIPEVLSHIILKLMEKRPENRYQSSLGVKADLEHCLDLFRATGHIHSFVLGSQDTFPALQVSEKVYGRERELQSLNDALEQAKAGRASCMLVGGFSGVGKTALVKELYKPITEKHGRFVQGKFDPLLHAPFSGILEAIRQLVQDVATLPPEAFRFWKEQLQDAMGHVGQALVDEIPEIETLVGVQPELTPASPQEAQHRFQRLLQRVLQVFATKEHPLVIFLDDLQWAKSSTLQFLFQTLEMGEWKHILVVGTFRSNEVDDSHPLMVHSKTLREASDQLTQIELEPLALAPVNQWVADSLFQTPRRTQRLSEEVYHKTKGNPFFVQHFLQALDEAGALWIERETNQWKWDLQKVRNIGFSDDVSELMAYELERLTKGARDLLAVAACVGAEFDLNPLQAVTGSSLAELTQTLQPAVQEGFVSPVGSSYKLVTLSSEEMSQQTETKVVYRFGHDRLREAALASQSENERKTIHHKLGNYFYSVHTKAGTVSDYLFVITNHWNLAHDLFNGPNQLELLLRLNLQAGHRAMDATAYPAAYEYFKAGLSLLEQGRLTVQRDIALDFQNQLSESARLSGKFEEAAAAEEQALALAETVEEKAFVLNQRLTRFNITFQTDGIAPACMELVSLFLDVPEGENAIEQLTGAEMGRVEELLAEREVSDLVHLPQANDSRVAMEIRSFTRIAYFFVWAPHLQMLSLCRAIRLSLEHGNTVESPFAYVNYAVPFALMGQYDKALAFSDLALAVNEKLNDTQSTRRGPLGQLHAPYMQHWREPLPDVEQMLRESAAIAMEHGNYEAVCLCAVNLLWVKIGAGKPLGEIVSHAEQSIATMQRLGQPFMIGTMSGVLLSLYTLTGEERKLAALAEQGIVEDTLIEQFKAMFPPSAAELYYRRMERNLLLDKLDKAKEDLENALPLMAPPFSMPTLPLFHLHQCVLYAKLFPKASAEEQHQYKQSIEENVQKLKAWGERVPFNYLYMYHHALGELSALKGNVDETEEHFEKAIALAQKHNTVAGEALALERASEQLEYLGKTRAARSFRVDAYNAYVQRNAYAKTAQLEVRFPFLKGHSTRSLAAGSTSLEATMTVDSTSTNHGQNLLDLNSILAASQAFSEEIALDKTLMALMRVVVQNAGAERGLLLLPGSEGLRIEAEMESPTAEPVVLQSKPVDVESLATTAVRYAVRTLQRVTEGEASLSGSFVNDPYVVENRVMSLLCMPLLKQGELVGLLYLENNQTSQAFTEERCSVLDLLSSQLSISINNARLYANLEEKVEERTSELRHANERLEETYADLSSKHRELQDAQAQLVQSAKMAGLGTLVAGIAHELNNPISFSRQGAQNLERRTKELKEFLFQLVGEDNQEVLDLFEERLDPIFKNLTTVMDGTTRISDIVKGLQLFSKHDEAQYKQTNVAEDLVATLSLVEAQYKNEVVYHVEAEGEILLTCWAAQLNQAFMNVLRNASQAILTKQEEMGSRERGEVVIKAWEEGGDVVVQIHDNGCGMNEDIRARAFEPFFTTRPVGSGTGLGLSSAFGVIQKHNGTIQLESTLYVGTTVTIRIPTKKAAS